MKKFTHDMIEKNIGLMLVLVILTISVGGLVEIVPLFFRARPRSQCKV
jgi:cytochrome c oxidase cbb3-type subunit II